MSLGHLTKPSKKQRLAKADGFEGLVMRTSHCSVGSHKSPTEFCYATTAVQCVQAEKENATTCVVNGKRFSSFNKDTFYADTGTSVTLDNDTVGLYDAVRINEKVKGFNGKLTPVTWSGKKDYLLHQTDGVTRIYKGVEVKVSEEIDLKLLAIQWEAEYRPNSDFFRNKNSGNM